MADILLEVCVDDIAGLTEAVSGGADRIELCSALSIGGLTPSPGLIACAAQAPIPVYAMIRPRSGNFIYAAAEIDLMKRDIDAVRAGGLSGIVIGATRADGRLDDEALGILIAHAAGLGTTLHRAFDLVPDITEAVETAAGLGFERILTSGGAASSVAGLDGMRRAVEASAGRISIMPGSGVTPHSIHTLLAGLVFREVHSSCSRAMPEEDEKLLAFGFATATSRRTDAEMVRALKRKLLAA